MAFDRCKSQVQRQAAELNMFACRDEILDLYCGFAGFGFYASFTGSPLGGKRGVLHAKVA